ncbi:MAG: DUF1295 domain-containing protein [Planctomycetota bacterium]|jgi:steroid 5-alpha reductase family enzyme
MNAWLLIGIGWAAMAVVMTALWFVQRARRNAGIVDVAWSFGTGLVAAWFAWGAGGDPLRRIVIGTMAAAWGARLGLYLVRRVLGEAEDGRYRMLRERWGDRAQMKLFWFFQVQAGWAVMFALPMLAAAGNPAPAPTPFDIAGIAVWLLAVTGETIADRQLAVFRRDPANRGRVCRTGLWRYSRHPNYFFEWLHWWAYVLLAVGWTWGWLAVLGPVVMLVFLLKITGIPMTEERALQTRGDAYRDYQRTTNVFFPGPPRRSVPT